MDRDPFDLVGDVLDGQYRVDAFAGEGDLSVVYKGHHLGVDAPVAIKCLNLPETLDRTLALPLIEGFNEASRVHYRLARGNLHIAQTIASGSTLVPRSGVVVPYLVREWFEGESLASDLAWRRSEKRTGRPIEEALDLLETAFDGIAYAHAQGEVHLSINPSNLFVVGPEGSEPPRTLKVLDFGVARTMNAFSSGIPSNPRGPRRPGGLRLLFPAYAAPEQLDRNVGELGPWTDVYAIALVMMEVLSDRIVMAETETGAVVEHALDEQRRPTPQAHGLRLPSHVDRALARAVARSPGRRQKSAAELWKDVRAVVRTLAPRATTPLPIQVPAPVQAMAPALAQAMAPMQTMAPAHARATAPVRTMPAPAPMTAPPRILTPAPGRARAHTLVGLSPPAVLSVPGATDRSRIAGATSVVTKPMAFEPAGVGPRGEPAEGTRTPLPRPMALTPNGAAIAAPSLPPAVLSARPAPPLSAVPAPGAFSLPPLAVVPPPPISAVPPPPSRIPPPPGPPPPLANAIPVEQVSGTVLVDREPLDLRRIAPPPVDDASWLAEDIGPERAAVVRVDEPIDRGPLPQFALPRRLPAPLAFAFSPQGAPIVLAVAGAFFWMWAFGMFLWFCTLRLHHPRATAEPEPAASAATVAPAPPAAPEPTPEASVPIPAPAPSSSADRTPAAGLGDAPFRNVAAIRALDGKWRGIAKCRRGKLWGKASTTVTFAGDGSVTRVDVGAPFTGTPTGDCIADALSSVRVEPFGDSTAAVVYRVYVAPR